MMKNILFALFCLISGGNAAIILDENIKYIDVSIPAHLGGHYEKLNVVSVLSGEEFALSFLVLGEYTEPGFNFIAKYNDESSMWSFINLTSELPYDIEEIAFIPKDEIDSFKYSWQKGLESRPITSLIWQPGEESYKMATFNFSKNTIPEPSTALLFLLSLSILTLKRNYEINH